MANPQCEDGFTKIANDIQDAFCKFRIPGEERQVLDFIIRKTYGFNKKSDAIALSQFVNGTGIVKPHVVRAINGLLSKKVIIITKNGNDKIHVYELNKNYDQWEALPKKITLPKKVTSVTEKGKKSLPILGTTKDNITKDNITKDTLTSSSSKADPCPHQAIVEIYHEILPELPAVKIWTDKRKALLRSRWKEDSSRQSLDWWRAFFTNNVKTSDFLTGKKSEWKADLEWILKPTNFVKVLEGRYQNNGKPEEKPKLSPLMMAY